MLLDILKSLFVRRRPKTDIVDAISSLFQEAQDLRDKGLVHEAIKKYERIIYIDETNSSAMNNLGGCLIDVQEDDEAARWFAQAIYVDDACAPALVNYARHLTLWFKSAEAEEYLLRAGQLMPGSAYIDSVLASASLLRGDSRKACELNLSAWLKDFDSVTHSSCYLFILGYDAHTSAERCYQEHAFWVGTVMGGLSYPAGVEFDSFVVGEWSGEKIKIGYISPDFRGHSVGFFFRPLLEGHNRDVVELYGYNDLAVGDKYTDSIREGFDIFREVANVPDMELAKIIRDDKLDILVELSGHTGNHRMRLLMNRLARVQMTGLGYPLTTGIPEIDYKIVDAVTAPAGSEALYAENLLRLPGSFWCFNPLEDTPPVAPTPAQASGKITFGCFGNIAKISDEMLVAWEEIMRLVPSSRIILKAITFQDESAKSFFKGRLSDFGLDVSRIRFDMPDSAVELFSRYAEVDIVLDTFPFNGGTTTCFALWMGVPLVTISGEALISRMGASMLSSLGLDELVASDFSEYVDKAVSLANDIDRLVYIRSVIRPRMQSSSLGDGSIFAHDFETACVKLLAEPKNNCMVVRSVLPEEEIVRRAGILLDYGQLDAAGRVINYCLDHYPGSVAAIIQMSEILGFSRGVRVAKEYLLSAAVGVAATDALAVEMNIMRADLILGDYRGVERSALRLELGDLDVSAQAYVQMYRVAASAWSVPANGVISELCKPAFVSILVHCVDDELFAEVRSCITAWMIPGAYELIRVVGASRAQAYAGASISNRSEIVLMLREDVRIEAPDFHRQLTQALECADLVGVLGADQLRGGEVVDAGEGHVFGACISAAARRKEGFDCFVWGDERHALQLGMQVLDPMFMAAKIDVFRSVSFDTALYAGGSLCELDWTHRVFARGFSLAVAPALGVARLGVERVSGREWSECADIFAEMHGVPVKSWGQAKSTGKAVPVESIKAGVGFLEAWFLSDA